MRTLFVRRLLRALVGIALVLCLLIPMTVSIAQDATCSYSIKSTYVHEFAPGYWEVGSHSLITRIQFPEGIVDLPSTFLVSETAPLYIGNVLISPFGLNSIEGQISEFHPDQDTAYLIFATSFPDTHQNAYRDKKEEFFDQLKVWLSIDGGDFFEVEGSPIVSGCSYPGRTPSLWLRNWGVAITP